MKNGDNKKKGVRENVSFDTIRVRRTTLRKLKAYKDTTGTPMSVFVDKAVDERLKKLKFTIVK